MEGHPLSNGTVWQKRAVLYRESCYFLLYAAALDSPER